MARPYSDDLRSRVALFVVGGQTCRAAAALFGVSVSCAAIWSKRLRETESAAAKPMGGSRRSVLGGEREWLLRRVAGTPDLTLRALQAELAERGVTVSLWAVWAVFASAGITFKKKHSAAGARARGYRKPTAAMAQAPDPH